MRGPPLLPLPRLQGPHRTRSRHAPAWQLELHHRRWGQHVLLARPIALPGSGAPQQSWHRALVAEDPDQVNLLAATSPRGPSLCPMWHADFDFVLINIQHLTLLFVLTLKVLKQVAIDVP